MNNRNRSQTTTKDDFSNHKTFSQPFTKMQNAQNMSKHHATQNHISPTLQPIQCIQQNTLLQKYIKIQERLSQQFRYHEILMEAEKQKVYHYYDAMVHLIIQEEKSNLQFIDNKIYQLKKTFEQQLRAIQKKIESLQTSKRGYQSQASQNPIIFEFQFLKVQTKSLSQFKSKINEYFIQNNAQNSQKNERQAILTSIESSRKRSQSDTLQEHDLSLSDGKQTFRTKENQESQDFYKDSLVCDEDLANFQESKSRQKSRKYQLDQDEVICEQNQSNQSSILTQNFDY